MGKTQSRQRGAPSAKEDLHTRGGRVHIDTHTQYIDHEERFKISSKRLFPADEDLPTATEGLLVQVFPNHSLDDPAMDDTGSDDHVEYCFPRGYRKPTDDTESHVDMESCFSVESEEPGDDCYAADLEDDLRADGDDNGGTLDLEAFHRPNVVKTTRSGSQRMNMPGVVVGKHMNCLAVPLLKGLAQYSSSVESAFCSVQSSEDDRHFDSEGSSDHASTDDSDNGHVAESEMDDIDHVEDLPKSFRNSFKISRGMHRAVIMKNVIPTNTLKGDDFLRVPKTDLLAEMSDRHYLENVCHGRFLHEDLSSRQKRCFFVNKLSSVEQSEVHRLSWNSLGHNSPDAFIGKNAYQSGYGGRGPMPLPKITIEDYDAIDGQSGNKPTTVTGDRMLGRAIDEHSIDSENSTEAITDKRPVADHKRDSLEDKNNNQSYETDQSAWEESSETIIALDGEEEDNDITTVHDPQCLIAPETFESEEQETRHVSIKTEILQRQTAMQTCKRRALPFTSEESYVCEICGEFFPEEVYYQVHLNAHPVSIRHPALRCGGCGACFMELSDLHSHLDVNRRREGTRCHRCQQWFSTCEDLYRHRQFHQYQRERHSSLLGPAYFLLAQRTRHLRRI